MKIKKEDEIEIKRRLINGESIDQISSHFCVSISTVYNIINKNKLKYFTKINKIKKRENIIKLSLSGMTNKKISETLDISISTVYRLKRKKSKKFSEWAKGKFLQINEISEKYRNILSLDRFYIDQSDISSILLDLLIHTDQKNISNKEAYFLKYAPLKIKNMKSKIIKYELILQRVSEDYQFYSSPEDILIARESVESKL